MIDTCSKCGIEPKKWWLCEKTNEWICVDCHKRCPEYSKVMLPNGTRCRYAYKLRTNTDDKNLNLIFPALTSEIMKAREHWEKQQRVDLHKSLATLIDKYRVSEDIRNRANLRAHISAVQQLIREKKINA